MPDLTEAETRARTTPMRSQKSVKSVKSVKLSFMEQNNQQQKISIRFFNDKEVRAAWDYDGNRWLFSVVDVIAVLTDSKNLVTIGK